jgi:hypothetical protein
MSDLKSMFEKWDINSNKNLNEDQIDNLIKSKINNNFKKIDIRIINNFKNLHYAIEKNVLETYCTDTKDSLICKIYINKYYGGRIGFTHGGGSFFILYYYTVLLADNLFKNNQLYNIITINTSYIKAIPVPSFNMVVVSYIDEIITAEIVNYKNQVCVRLISKISNKINKF